MNQQQRKFFIDAIKNEFNTKIRVLDQSMPEFPSVDDIMLQKIVSNEFSFQPEEHIRKVMIEKAMDQIKKLRSRDTFISSSWFEKVRTPIVTIGLFDIVVEPEEIAEETRKVKIERDRIKAEIEALKSQMVALEARIMLASNKTLEKVISEIDNMGDIRLIDTKIKLLGS
jgi:hypothetical protein